MSAEGSVGEESVTLSHGYASRLQACVQFVSKFASLPRAPRAGGWPPGGSNTDTAVAGWCVDVPAQPGSGQRAADTESPAFYGGDTGPS